MPSGIPVATVAIDGAANAALLAIEILSVSDESLEKKLSDARAKSQENVLNKDKEISSTYGAK